MRRGPCLVKKRKNLFCLRDTFFFSSFSLRYWFVLDVTPCVLSAYYEAVFLSILENATYARSVFRSFSSLCHSVFFNGFVVFCCVCSVSLHWLFLFYPHSFSLHNMFKLLLWSNSYFWLKSFGVFYLLLCQSFLLLLLVLLSQRLPEFNGLQRMCCSLHSSFGGLHQRI